MKKFLYLFTALLIAAPCALAQYKEGYYDAMDGKKKDALKMAAKQCVQKHTRLEYYPLPNAWRYTDTYPELYDGNVRWWEMYSNNVYLIRNGQAPTSSFSANNMQREHCIPKSWWKQNNDVEYTPAYTDLWNLYPSDGACNQAKSNYPFGDVLRSSYDNGSAQVGTPVSGQGGGAPRVFEPADEYKGDFARTIFYMATVYNDLPWVYGYMFQTDNWPTLKPWAYETLLAWHRLDPVSQKELDRNNAVELQQGNRNPFIDFPNLAEYIWGTATTDVFYIADQSDAPIPVPDKTELTQPVNGEYLDFGECAVGGTVSAYLEIRGSITDVLLISLSGADRSMFTLGQTSVTPTMLNTTHTVLVPVTFTPTSLGEKTANLLLYDGGLVGSLKVNLKATACAVPELSRLTAYAATDVTESSYMAHWSAAPEVVDYYVVTRTIYGSDGTETETLESDETSLLVTRADNVEESYTVSSSRLGYLSEASNSVTVAPYAGVFSPEATSAIGVETMPGSFCLY